MHYKNTAFTYGLIAKLFHWIIALLVISMLCFGFFMGDFSKALQPTVYNTHKLIGLTILTLMVCRLLWALTNIKPVLPLGTKPFEKLAERTGHFTFYLLLLLMPLTAWVGTSMAGQPPHLFGTKLALPIHGSKALIETCFELHNTIAVLLIVLVTGHVMAALYHHFLRRDNILSRMWF